MEDSRKVSNQNIRRRVAVASPNGAGRGQPPPPGSSTLPRGRGAVDPAEIDRILDRVRDRGLQSLTDKEKETLRRDTEFKRSAGNS